MNGDYDTTLLVVTVSVNYLAGVLSLLSAFRYVILDRAGDAMVTGFAAAALFALTIALANGLRTGEGRE